MEEIPYTFDPSVSQVHLPFDEFPHMDGSLWNLTYFQRWMGVNKEFQGG